MNNLNVCYAHSYLYPPFRFKGIFGYAKDDKLDMDSTIAIQLNKKRNSYKM